MKTLSELLYKVPIVAVYGNVHTLIQNITFNSHLVQAGDAFIAIKGTNTDGHRYIEEAIQKGATVVIVEDMPKERHEHITYIQVQNSMQALGLMACNYYDNPSETLTIIGITGTNGKTTTATLLYQTLNYLGYKTGLISTVNYRIGEEIYPATHTTPDAITLNRIFRQMLAEGCMYCVMEVSSHALALHRVEGISFAGAVFTNITHDHLDFHKTFDHYRYSKKKLFDMLPVHAFAAYNHDDKNGTFMIQNCRGRKIGYGLQKDTNIKAKIIESGFHGLWLHIDGYEVWFKLIGKFNAYNITAAYTVLCELPLHLDKLEILTALSTATGAQGRFEAYISSQGKIGIVDYAHTPDALENVLSTIEEIKNENQKIITVVGCGGNRDAAKRPEMARIALFYSDTVILTSDNPRFEDPDSILDDMEKGIQTQAEQNKVLRITDRKTAIQTAVKLAKPNDIILIAGKGHETYQEIKGIKYPFDDKEVLLHFFSQEQ
jgi:UDP-N-acetylmuramoyl-L-alanyl-D-glutamate--2,6-diaminopimelate ligase